MSIFGKKEEPKVEPATVSYSSITDEERARAKEVIGKWVQKKNTELIEKAINSGIEVEDRPYTNAELRELIDKKQGVN